MFVHPSKIVPPPGGVTASNSVLSDLDVLRKQILTLS